jgi:hypothetical protein
VLPDQAAALARELYARRAIDTTSPARLRDADGRTLPGAALLAPAPQLASHHEAIAAHLGR